MATPNRLDKPTTTSQTEQYVLNYSFDELYKILMVGLAAYNPTLDRYDRVQIGNNGGLVTDSAVTTSRYDLQAPIYYVGTAPVGTAESTAAWTITKYDLTANPYSGKVASNVAWTGRAGASYG